MTQPTHPFTATVAVAGGRTVVVFAALTADGFLSEFRGASGASIAVLQPHRDPAEAEEVAADLDAIHDNFDALMTKATLVANAAARRGQFDAPTLPESCAPRPPLRPWLSAPVAPPPPRLDLPGPSGGATPLPYPPPPNLPPTRRTTP